MQQGHQGCLSNFERSSGVTSGGQIQSTFENRGHVVNQAVQQVIHRDLNITSIAAQLASKSSSLKRSICEAIAEHSDIVSQALRDQWNRLVLQPLSKLEANSLQSPLLIVIDALDECEGEDDIGVILQLLAAAPSAKG